ncbi:MAG: 4-phosphoerythronate dehydrogenase [Verrucomicrobia bacterium]|nr:4-phosphoerythronate dehydrogenase [Verrucomicrobiota bacterium]MCG2679789.1 4-phosphoerythronate dehydrogenase [Kiritimatiellia bacterium]MBU4247108.1 4-phosphoerythronate dehydrogenase [Verrucomicrobiota bacterium]MBU4289994.1 4-phosphoerythronate dehydrogenase [Verrucomicrobiota bacterium]MBU4428657.1 4-phosphoerythronate dehydrogenase [Verrucomicrobiota bacterium]
MKIICATNMPYAEEAFRTLGDAMVLAPRDITPERVRDVDLLAVRSTTRVNRVLLERSRVRFVGTATIGIDHLDTDYLEKAGITWCSAAGCNADSVSEYVVTALLCLGRRHGLTLAGKTIGVIGVGNVGSRVVQKAAALGLRVLQNDPPRGDATADPIFRPLDEVLSVSDIVTLHIPVTKAGSYPTIRMADCRFFERMKRAGVFINSARGGVMDSDALLAALDKGIVAHVVLDTWEGEPVFRPDVLAKADLGTPHIAGHSFEGKVMGTVMVYREACRFLGVAPTWTPDGLLPPPLVPEIRLATLDRPEEALLDDIARQVYDIEADDRRLREIAGREPQGRAEDFEQQRQDYPIRREFRFTRIVLPSSAPSLEGKLRGLGFEVGLK